MEDVTLVDAVGERTSPGWVRLRGGLVEEVGTGRDPHPSTRRVPLAGHRLAPGFVDQHVHGGDGAEVNVADPADLPAALARITAFHARHGTTGLLATTVSDTHERLTALVRGISAAREDGGRPSGARVLGAHLEGPYLSPARCGAQDPAVLRPADPAELEELLEPGAVRLVTLAPELPGAEKAVRRLVEAGVVASLGHTDADHATAGEAFGWGMASVTHLFNAMPGLHHRRPGPVAAALERPDVTVELVADGVHVHPSVLRLAFAAAPGRVALVTDAMAAAGLPDGDYALGGLRVRREGRRVVLVGEDGAPGAIAGSVLTMRDAVACAVGAGVPVADALAAASATPARLLGLPHAGRVAPGAPADLVVLDDALEVRLTLVGGHPVHDPGGLLAATTTGPTGTDPSGSDDR
ncbi:N-acetylglucosamine-6-phosphate deacetylase [Vallicoccus soli]|uniref:N-acetylglucosamine-6-phosphate deacetylase n=1 Tax=Vallicoccus soli TaxID=2339232 RepID=A0A3A3Z1W2_9ACTN|nr:N-acetylglucosamine-6-phosphate deacetylase [Vallicoccus soli]